MLFFRQFNDTSKTTPSEIAALDEFKKDIKLHGLFREYKTAADFEKVFTDALELFLADNWLKVPFTQEREKNKDIFSDNEIAAVKKWVESNNNSAYVLSVMGGKIYVLGNLNYQVNSGREEAQWTDFFERLERVGFIRFIKNNNQGSPVYELQKRAYDYFENKQ